MTDGEIRSIFADAEDFETRILRSEENRLYAYFIDGLVSGSEIARFVFQPIVQNLPENVADAYQAALHGAVYNSVGKPCMDLQDAAIKLVNGFCVVLFPEVGALAFEVKT